MVPVPEKVEVKMTNSCWWKNRDAGSVLLKKATIWGLLNPKMWIEHDWTVANPNGIFSTHWLPNSSEMQWRFEATTSYNGSKFRALGTTDGQVALSRKPSHLLGIQFGTHRSAIDSPSRNGIWQNHQWTWLYVTKKNARITSFNVHYIYILYIIYYIIIYIYILYTYIYIYICNNHILYMLMEHDGTSTFIGDSSLQKRLAQVLTDRIWKRHQTCAPKSEMCRISLWFWARTACSMCSATRSLSRLPGGAGGLKLELFSKVNREMINRGTWGILLCFFRQTHMDNLLAGSDRLGHAARGAQGDEGGSWGCWEKGRISKKKRYSIVIYIYTENVI
jgi:hypothetical protein